MKNLRTIILAAGKGTRMKSSLPKVLHPVCGKPIIQYILDVAKAAGSLKTSVVLGHKAKEVQAQLQPGQSGVDVRVVRPCRLLRRHPSSPSRVPRSGLGELHGLGDGATLASYSRLAER